mmetsp:Transcript_10913/g.30620  ORF Transcript_10913/g.30620 Transcript_10913/m.30620 type:complete len:1136 (-) Transcript_10913:140-3547(-)
MAIVGKKKSSSSGASGFGATRGKSGRFLSSVSMKKPKSPLRYSRRNVSTPSEEPNSNSSTMKVAIVSRNRATETPATAAPTPGTLDSYVGDMVSSALDTMAGPLEACGILDKSAAGGPGGGNGEENAAAQLTKMRSGQRLGGEKFARAPVWGIAPVLSDDEDDTRMGHDMGYGPAGSDVGEYDDVELVLQQTPERGGARTAAAGSAAAGTGGTGGVETPSANLAGALEAEASRARRQEQEEVVHAARRELLRNKEEGRSRRQAAALAAAGGVGAAGAASTMSTNNANHTDALSRSTAHTEDFVDASVASALETWRSATDPATGRTYYYNRVTKETKWDPPPELVDAYRSVVAKKAAMAGTSAGGGGGNTGGADTAAVGGAAVFGAAAAAAAVASSSNNNPNDSRTSDVNTTQTTTTSAAAVNKSALSKGGKSLRKMLGMGKKGKKSAADGTTAAVAATSADQAVLNGVAAAEEELPDDELTDLGLSPTTTTTTPASNVEVVRGADGEVSIERSASTMSHQKKGRMAATVQALRTRTRSINKTRSSASTTNAKKKKKKEPRVHGWRSVVDETSGKTYYYHTLTKETKWDKPDDYDEALDMSKKKKKRKSKGGGAGASSSANKPKRAIWKEAVDQNSGKTYFYHTITKEVTWVKPAGFDEQQEMLKKEQEERRRRRAEEKERKRAASAVGGPPPAGGAAASGPAFDPVNLELQKALARALPDQQDQHDQLLEQYTGREDDLLVALEELQEDTPFDECIEYDAVLAKMDQIEVRKSGNVLALAGAAVSAAAASAAAAVSSSQPPTKDAPSLGRTYSTYTSGTGMRSELTERVNNVTTKSALPGVAPIAEDGEDDDETSISSKAEDAVQGGADAALQQTSEAVRTRSQRSNASRTTGRSTGSKLKDGDSYAGDNEHADQYSVSDSVSALSTDLEYAGLRARQERRQKKALGAAMEEKDWNKAASVAQELSTRVRSDDSNQKPSTRYRSSERTSKAREVTPDKEFNQSELDQYIAKNDWNSVAQYIAVMRSASQDDRDKRQPRTPRRDARSHASYGGSQYSESPNMPRKQVGARSQLQFTQSYESESSDWETDSQATDGSDWESLTSGPQGPPSYYSRETRERRRNDNAPANVPKRKMQV